MASAFDVGFYQALWFIPFCCSRVYRGKLLWRWVDEYMGGLPLS